MTSQLRLAAVAVVLLIPGAYLNGWLSIVEAQPTALEFGVPGQLGAWVVTGEDRLDARSEAILEPTSYVLRRYEAPGHRPVYLYVAFYADRSGTAAGAHDPEICYPSSGWDRVAAEVLDLPVSSSSGNGSLPVPRAGSDDHFRAKLLDMRRGSDQELVLYWFQPAERWPGNELLEELRYVVDAVAGRPQYAFVRLVGVPGSAEERPQIRADLEAFASEIAWPVRAALSGSGEAASQDIRASFGAPGYGS